jgi:site-specific recombinase XerD
MKLSKVVSDYVNHKQALGMRYEAEAKMLASFCRAQGDVEIQSVDHASVSAFIAGRGPLTRTWHGKYSVLAGLYRYAMARGYAASAPLPTTIPKLPPPFRAYIYSLEELKRLTSATATYNRIIAGRMLLGSTLRVMLLAMYGTGMRRGEVLSLVLEDVDLSSRLLTVRDTKFFKTRLVPIGPHLAAELAEYLRQRRRLPCADGGKSSFFVTRRGKKIDDRCLNENFRKLCELAGVRRESSARYQPRLHDLRHTFAVHRLVAWYRAGADVQRLLPHLSTYLGHINIAATMCYLSMTPELLAEASRRFEDYVSKEVSHVR